MADRLNGYRILILENARGSAVLPPARRTRRRRPAVPDVHDPLTRPDPAPIEAWIRRCVDQPFDDLVLTTGEGLRRLMKVVRRINAESAFIAALGQARKYARGPKPGRALREIGLEPQVTTEKPTSEGIAEMLSARRSQGASGLVCNFIPTRITPG